MSSMPWERVLSLDAPAMALAARHYSRQSPESVQLAPPGKRLYFVTPDRRALWASSEQRFAAPHRVGSWVCTFFRNEGQQRGTDLIAAAIAATRHCWGDPPERGMATEIDPREVPGFRSCIPVALRDCVTDRNFAAWLRCQPPYRPRLTARSAIRYAPHSERSLREVWR